MNDWLWTATTIDQLILSICHHQLRRLRPGTRVSATEVRNLLDDQSQLQNLDSLEIYQLAAQVAVFFELHKTQVEHQLLEDPKLSNWRDIVLQGRQSNDQAVSFQTSGSTGQPKVISHDLSLIIDEAQFWKSQLRGIQLLRSNVPKHHIFGFIFSTVLPALLEVDCIDMIEKPPSYLFSKTDKQTAAITYPEALNIFIETGHCVLSNIITISSTAPCDADISMQLLAKGIDQHFHIYGSTETSGVGIRKNTDKHFTLLPFLKNNANQQIIHTGNNNTALDLQDNIEFLSENTFELRGRTDKSIQIGGYNVSLKNIESKLLTHPAIEAVSVRTFTTSIGLRLKAFIVVNKKLRGSGDTYDRAIDEIAEHIRFNFSNEETPSEITYGNCLPRTPEGKLTDWGRTP